MNFIRKQINGFRFYIKDGLYYVSNTSIGKFLHKDSIVDWQIRKALQYILDKGVVTPEIVSEAKEYPKLHLNELADLGTKKHAMMEKYLLTGKRPKKSKWMDLFQTWERDYNFKTKPCFVERPIFNAELGVAGTADIIGKVNGQTTLVDLKTSGGIYLSHLVQVCGYKLMLDRPMKLAILQISRDASSQNFYILDDKDEKYYTSIFCALLDIFKAQYELGILGLDIARENMVYLNKGIE